MMSLITGLVISNDNMYFVDIYRYCGSKIFSCLNLGLIDIPILGRFCMSSGPDGANGEFIFH